MRSRCSTPVFSPASAAPFQLVQKVDGKQCCHPFPPIFPPRWSQKNLTCSKEIQPRGCLPGRSKISAMVELGVAQGGPSPCLEAAQTPGCTPTGLTRRHRPQEGAGRSSSASCPFQGQVPAPSSALHVESSNFWGAFISGRASKVPGFSPKAGPNT